MDTHAALAPPVVTSVRVPLPPAEAFTLFTNGMGGWWPLATHSISADTHEGAVAATDVSMGSGVGGRIVESMSDGTQADWGEVLEWEPPRRLAYLWHLRQDRADATEVEILFVPAGDGTAVTIVHRGWERLGAKGPELRERNTRGWAGLLGHFERAAAAPRPIDGSSLA
jgi:uncharacterized protein YndB with AHSA1/START domain